LSRVFAITVSTVIAIAISSGIGGIMLLLWDNSQYYWQGETSWNDRNCGFFFARFFAWSVL